LRDSKHLDEEPLLRIEIPFVMARKCENVSSKVGEASSDG